MIECVPNFSEGRNSFHIDAFVDAISSVPGAKVIHRTSDADHNRTVITFIGEPAAIAEAAVRATAKAAELIDLNHHRGVHPRLGALDVLPFVPLEGATMADCISLAHAVGARIWNELRIPVFFYQQAALRPTRVQLENVRRGQFEGIGELALTDPAHQPDVGGPALHPTAGAVIVGARKLLIAWNVNLNTTDLSVAKSIASRIRASSGGFPSVKALGLPLASRNLVQVSMNLTDYMQTSMDVVYLEIARLASERGVEIAGTELIGLVPAEALQSAAGRLLRIADFDSQRVLENRIRTARE